MAHLNLFGKDGWDYKTEKYTHYYDLYNKVLIDIAPLKYFNGIRKLSLEKNFIKDITSLYIMNVVNEINLNPITNISSISKLPSLKAFKLVNTRFLNNIQPLNYLPNLKLLEMSHGKKDLKVLNNLQNLKGTRYLLNNPQVAAFAVTAKDIVS